MIKYFGCSNMTVVNLMDQSDCNAVWDAALLGPNNKRESYEIREFLQYLIMAMAITWIGIYVVLLVKI